jgi:hypothetical protein
MTTPPTDWSYSGDPSLSDLDEVRSLCGDIDPVSPLLTDSEINYLIMRVQGIYGAPDRTQTPPETSSNIMVAAYAADLVARKFAGVMKVSADGVTVDLTTITANYKQMAIELRAEYQLQQSLDGEPVDSSVLLDQLDDDCGIRPLMFGIGMYDNPEAGRQDYGGWGEWIHSLDQMFGYGL